MLSYLIGRHFTSDPTLLAACVVLGLLPDIDHISHIGRALKSGRFGAASRSRFHELYGLSIFSALFGLVIKHYPDIYFLYFPLLGHYLFDFLTRPTRPLYPFENTVQHGSMYPQTLKWMTVADVIVTAFLLLGVLL